VHPDSDSPSRRCLAAFVGIGLLTVLFLGGAPAVWARPGIQSLHQTVPTMGPTRTPAGTRAPTSPAPAASVTPEVPKPGTVAAPTAPTPPWPAPVAGVSVRIRMRADAVMVTPRQTFQYLIEVQNLGAAPSGKLIVRDVLPASLDVLAVRPSFGAQNVQSNAVNVEVNSLPAGAEWRIEIDVAVKATVPLGSVIENRATLEQPGGPDLQTEPVLVVLPPAELPPTGGA